MATQDRIPPPPPGVTPNYVDPPSLFAETVALNTVLITLMTIALALRVYARRFIVGKLWWDDWACIVSWILAVILCAFVIFGHTQGLGKHGWDVPRPLIGPTLKTFFITRLLYILAGGITRLSYLIFFKTIFSANLKSKIPIWIGTAFVSIVTVVTFMLALLRCIPIQAQWDRNLGGDKCIDASSLATTTAVCAIIADVYILLLPFPFLWGLQMSLAKKLRLLAVFALGSISCAASITRLVVTFTVFFRADMTMDMSHSLMWTVVEVDVGIIASCMLAFPALLKHKKIRSIASRFKLSASRKESDNIRLSDNTSSSLRHLHSLEAMGGNWTEEPKLTLMGKARTDPVGEC
jgi:hypothetical protein